jgi:hypothetical protein
LMTKSMTSQVQIVSSVDLVIVVALAFIHPSINVGERQRTLELLVKLEFSVAEDLGRLSNCSRGL